MTKSNKTVNIYACGGCGVNVAGKLSGLPSFDGLDVFVTYVDTSKANLKNAGVDINSNSCYLFPGEQIDGSGGHRLENAAIISRHVQEILLQHRPGDFNIVIGSGGGGSGSVIAPEILSGLLERDCWSIGFLVGSTSSIQELNNTIGTIKSYMGISRVREKPTVIGYYQNTPTHRQSVVDSNIYRDISALLNLFATTGDGLSGLDTRDLRNWVEYNRVTTTPSQLSLFTIFHSEHIDALDEIGDAVSVATLGTSKDSLDYPGVIGYHTYGVVSGDVESGPLHYVISTGFFGKVLNDLTMVAQEYKKKSDARASRTTTFDVGTTTSSGMCF